MLTTLALLTPLLAVPALAGPVAADPDPRTAARSTASRTVDLQAHRGGMALTVESTRAGFARALRLGVTTLELDTQVTEDGVAVVTHDRRTNPQVCSDTAPATPGDPDFPYVGSFVRDLSWDQLATLDCGSTTKSAAYPAQLAVPGARMLRLDQLFDLVETYGADGPDGVRMNIETKVEAGAPAETAPRGRFVRSVLAEIEAAGVADQVSIQSFDWGSLNLVDRLAPELPLVALDNEDFLQAGQPGASPWLGGADIDDHDGDPVAAIDALGYDAWSPVQGRPQNGAIGDGTFVPYATRADVRAAHRRGLGVIPWTVNDRATMAWYLDRGVDGLITDRPDVLRDLMAERGIRLPTAYANPGGRVVLPPAHAHNDYEHERPLVDALSRGFTSVEADVWLRDGELLVGHDEVDLDPARTLRSLYLEPLARRVQRLDGRVHRGSEAPLQLLVDLKTDGPTTYAALDAQLREVRSMLTRFAPRPRPGAVEVVVSGNRPLADMQAQRTRWAGYDGRLRDLDSDLPPAVMPLVSDNWANHFTWTGAGPMPAAEHARLVSLVRRAHTQGYRLRFWNTPDVASPDRARLWAVLADTGVDHLNTDDLPGLSTFLVDRGFAEE